MYFFEIHASVVKLADALDSGSSGSDPMQVQVLSLAPSHNSLNFFTVKRMFGLFCYIEEFKEFRT